MVFFDFAGAATSSESTASCKSDRRIFETTLARADCAPGEVLFVGDSMAHDVAGPTALGTRTAWLAVDDKRGIAGLAPDFVIGAIGDVPALLDSVTREPLERYLDERLGGHVPLTGQRLCIED